MPIERQDSLIGCILGTAAGDALGLPCEGLSRHRQRKLFGEITTPNFLPGRGMVSDDTEHTCMVGQALIEAARDTTLFKQSFARQLRGWLLCLPAGAGQATLRAAIRLWRGVEYDLSGVFSAGNGPSMRSAIIGAAYGHDPVLLAELVRASTRLTHTDPKAEWGALAVAVAAGMAARQGEVTPSQYVAEVSRLLTGHGSDLLEVIELAAASAAAGHSTPEFATACGFGNGVSGYTYHTVPVALHAWLRHQGDLRSAVLQCVHCGGDTDSTAAIAGGIIGAGFGKAVIPEPWLDRLWEWPRTVPWMEHLGGRLAEVVSSGKPQPPLPLSTPGLFSRNLLFLFIALAKASRRLLPPY